MSITVDFILRASSASFTKAVAQASNSMEDLKKSLHKMDLGKSGRGLKEILGVGGIIEGFKIAIESARELRDEADKLHKPLDANVRAAAEFGDTLVKVGKGFKEAAAHGLGFFAKVGQDLGTAINKMRGFNEEQQKMMELTEKAADKAEERLQKSREENTPEKVKAAKSKTEDTASRADDGTRLAFVLTRQKELEKEMAQTGKETVKYQELKNEYLTLEQEKKKQIATWDKEAQEKADKAGRQELKLAEESDKEYAKQKKDLISKFAPNVDELAKQETGIDVDPNDPRLKARQIKRDEERASMLFSRGDYKGGLTLAQGAADARKALESRGMSGEGGYLTEKSMETAVSEALKATNDQLTALNTTMKGIIKAQK